MYRTVLWRIMSFMGIFSIMRPQFLDRIFGADELRALAEMLRLWYLICASDHRQTGQIRCEARVYAFPRTQTDTIRQSLTTRLPAATFDGSDPDELRVIGPAQSATKIADLSIWREMLTDPLLARACLLLRITIEGPVKSLNDRSYRQGTTTLVLCGEPANGALFVKGIWRVGRDESMQLVYRSVAWPHEQQFVAALDLYLQECETAPRDRAAKTAFDRFTTKTCHAFLTHREERYVMRTVRFRTEMPDEHGVAAFLRRFVGRLIAAAALATLAFVLRDRLLTAAFCTVAAIYLLYSAGAVAWRKIRRVRRYHASMRRGLGKLYSGTIDYLPIDLSDNRTPTLLKCTKEIEALGGHHVGDITASYAQKTVRGQRHFAVGDATASVGLLEESEKHLYFPARPVIIISTQFKDGHRHLTLNHPIHRKTSRPQITRRCLLNGGGIDEQMALHRRFVEKLIADGAIPMPPPKTPAALLNHLRQLHEENREAWQRSPYSWGDAVHDAFKLCRRDARP